MNPYQDRKLLKLHNSSSILSICQVFPALDQCWFSQLSTGLIMKTQSANDDAANRGHSKTTRCVTPGACHPGSDN